MIMKTEKIGFNSIKSQYNETFILACKDEKIANKWVVITRWLIK